MKTKLLNWLLSDTVPERHKLILLHASIISIALVLSTPAAFVNGGRDLRDPHSIIFPLIGLVLCLFGIFLIEAYRNVLSIKTYLKLERDLLIGELPNIIQFFTLIALVSFTFQEQLYTRVLASIGVAGLLLIYIHHKRRSFIKELPRNISKVAYLALAYTTGILLWLIVLSTTFVKY